MNDDFDNKGLLSTNVNTEPMNRLDWLFTILVIIGIIYLESR